MSCIPVTVTDVVLSRSQRIRKGRVLTCGGGGIFFFLCCWSRFADHASKRGSCWTVSFRLTSHFAQRIVGGVLKFTTQLQVAFDLMRLLCIDIDATISAPNRAQVRQVYGTFVDP